MNTEKEIILVNCGADDYYKVRIYEIESEEH